MVLTSNSIILLACNIPAPFITTLLIATFSNIFDDRSRIFNLG